LTNGLNNTATSTIPRGDSGQSKNTAVWRWRNLISQGVLVPQSDPTSTSPATDGVYVGGNRWTSRWDEASESSYVWNNSTAEFISFEDPVSISYKREWAVKKGLQGMMIWQVGYDREGGELLKYMN
jgi:GH18 family chitinase